MSIKSAAYQLVKAVQRSPLRDELRGIIRSLNVTTDAEREAGRDRSQFGYHARKQRIQLLGYLVVDAQRERLPFPLPYLDQHEKNLIGAFQREILDLNSRCMHLLLKDTAIPPAALDPYNQYRYAVPDRLEGVQFLSESELDAMVAEFAGHGGIAQARRTLPPHLSQIPERRYFEDVLRLVAGLEAGGVHDAPDELVRVALHSPANAVERTALQHVAAVASVRASLQVLDQMLYQGLMDDRLPVINEDNLIKVVQRNSNVIGNGLTVVHVMDEKVGHVEPVDLILVLGEVFNSDHSFLGIAHGCRFSFSHDMGTTGEISMRLLDDDLNPYPGLIEV